MHDTSATIDERFGPKGKAHGTALSVATLYASLYNQAETSVAKIEPTKRSSIQPRTIMRLKVAQVASERLRGKLMTKPMRIPTRRAVTGPGPRVVRTET